MPPASPRPRSDCRLNLAGQPRLVCGDGLLSGSDRQPAATPLKGFVAWGPPSDVIELFRGPIGYRTGAVDLPPLIGSIALVLRSGSHLLWTVDLETAPEVERYEWRYRTEPSTETLNFDFLGSHLELTCRMTSDGRGDVPGDRTGDGDDRHIVSVTAHWVNLPNLRAGSLLHEDHEQGWSEWAGRWQMSLAGWTVTIDSRRDLGEVLTAAQRDYLHVVTHTMEVRREDHATFSGSSVDDFLTGLQFAMSFAVGRWTAPVLAVGLDSFNAVVWSLWAPLHVDTPARGSGRWWVEHRPEDLKAFLSVFMGDWVRPGERETLNFALTSAIAAGESGFVEQRIMTSLAALENLSWTTEVLQAGSDEAKWGQAGAAWRVRRLMTRAKVPLGIKRENSPGLWSYARANGLGDGPAALIAIRNAVTHPKDTGSLYEEPGLVGEASRLCSRYLDLAILHRLGYQGQVADRTRTYGWAGECEPVPWAEPESG